MLSKIEYEKYLEKFNKISINSEVINSTIKKVESERNSRILLKLKRKSLFVFDIKNSKNNFKNNKFIINSIKSCDDSLNFVSTLNNPKNFGLDLNEKNLTEKKNTEEENKIKFYNSENSINKNIFPEKISKNTVRKYRIKLRSERLLNNELKAFFENTSEVTSNNLLNTENLITFYDFDLDKYYNSENIQNNNFNNFPNQKNSFDKNPERNSNKNFDESNYENLVAEVLDKLRGYLQLKNFSKKIKKFILNLILNSILILKTSLLKWLINQILNNNDNNSTYINKNNLLFDWVDLNDKYINEHPILNSENTQDLSDEEITKFLDYIDPMENSITSNILSCEFCGRYGPRRLSGRLIHLKNELWGHVNCTIRSRGIYETMEGNVLNVGQVLNKIKSYKCVLCRRYGATIICEFKKCGKNYHFPCALAKQSIFGKNGKFYCLKCTTAKDEFLTNFDSKRRIVVVKNSEFINDSRLNYLIDYNFNKILPKYFVGSIVKFGNTSILKFFNLNKKDLTVENYDINIIKLVDGFIKIEDSNIISKNNNFINENLNNDNNNILDIEKNQHEFNINIDLQTENCENNNVNFIKNINDVQENKEENKKICIDIENNLNIFSEEVGKNKIEENNLNELKINNSDDNKKDNLQDLTEQQKSQEFLGEDENKSCNSSDLVRNKKFMLLQINENGFNLTEFDNISHKELEGIISRFKITNNFEKSDFMLNMINIPELFNFDLNAFSNKSIRQVINIPTEKIINLNPNKDNFENLMKNTISKFNGKLKFFYFKRKTRKLCKHTNFIEL